MPDPVSLVILGGAAGKITDRLMDVLLPDFAGGKAKREAATNALNLCAKISERLDRVENEFADRGQAHKMIEDELGNPDFSYVVRPALLAAARTDGEVRHEILSRAVIERLLGAPDSIRAVASGLAIDALGRLSSLHLELLGLAALIYYIGPTLRAPHEIPGDAADHLADAEHPQITEVSTQLVDDYVRWLRRQN
jgi:hypothetical protein